MTSNKPQTASNKPIRHNNKQLKANYPQHNKLKTAQKQHEQV